MFEAKLRARITIAASFLALGCLFGFFYLRLTGRHLNAFEQRIYGIRGPVSLRLAGPQTYLIKIWGRDAPQAVSFNATPLVHSVYRDRKKAKEFYYKIPAERVDPTENTLRIDGKGRYEISIKNYLGRTDFGLLAFRTEKSKSKTAHLALAALFFFGLLYGLRVSFVVTSRGLLGFQVPGLNLRFIFSCLPSLAFFAVIVIGEYYYPVRFIIFPWSFFALVVLSIFLLSVCSLLLSLLSEFSRYFTNEEKDAVLRSSRFYLFYGWWGRGLFSEKCLIVFVVFSSLTALSILARLMPLADVFTSLAYAALLPAVLAKVFGFARRPGKDI